MSNTIIFSQRDAAETTKTLTREAGHTDPEGLRKVLAGLISLIEFMRRENYWEDFHLLPKSGSKR